MSLDKTQKSTVRDWIHAGVALSEIQKRLAQEMGVSLTYMELRFLVDDLGVVPKDPDTLAAPAPSPNPIIAPPSGGNAPGSTTVTVDQVTRAGARASGKVTFVSGKSAGWSLDELGRLGLTPDEPGYRPSREDMLSFETELQKVVSSMRM